MTSRKPIVAGNWKMNTTIAEGLALVDEMLPRLQAIEAVERVVCPPFVSLSAIADRLRGSAGIARVQRWFGGSVLVGLGILAAVWSPSHAR